MVKDFQKAGIKLWLVSGDTEESCVSAARCGHLLKSTDKVANLCNITNIKNCNSALLRAINQFVYKTQALDESIDSIA